MCLMLEQTDTVVKSSQTHQTPLLRFRRRRRSVRGVDFFCPPTNHRDRESGHSPVCGGSDWWQPGGVRGGALLLSTAEQIFTPRQSPRQAFLVATRRRCLPRDTTARFEREVLRPPDEISSRLRQRRGSSSRTQAAAHRPAFRLSRCRKVSPGFGRKPLCPGETVTEIDITGLVGTCASIGLRRSPSLRKSCALDSEHTALTRCLPSPP